MVNFSQTTAHTYIRPVNSTSGTKYSELHWTLCVCVCVDFFTCIFYKKDNLSSLKYIFYISHTFPLLSGLLAVSEGTRGVEVSNNFFGAALVVMLVVLDLFEVAVDVSDWLVLKDDCRMSRIDPKSMVTGFSVLLSS